MKVLIIGANGQIGTTLAQKLKKSAHHPVAMVRDPKQQKPFEDKSIDTVVADLEEDFEHAYEGTEAVVFTAGSGAHTGKDKTNLVDRIGAKRAVDMALKQKVDRFVMVSAMGAGLSPDQWPEAMAHYMEAKKDADEHLIQSGLNYTIVMPGRLTNDNGTNNVELSESIEAKSGSIPRTDVATVLEKTLDHEKTYRKGFDLISGDTPVDDALDKLL